MTSFPNRCLPLWLAATIYLLGVASPVTAAPTLDSSPKTACVLLMGGGGSVTPDKNVNSRWFVINSTVSRNVMSALTVLGYRMEDFIVDIQDANKRAGALFQQLSRTGCGKVVQVVHQLRSADNSQYVTRFAFVVSVLHLEPADPSNPAAKEIRFAGDYNKEYEYPLTKEIMENLSLSELARSIAADIDKAGVLEK
jgi:hypothetical protein